MKEGLEWYIAKIVKYIWQLDNPSGIAKSRQPQQHCKCFGKSFGSSQNLKKVWEIWGLRKLSNQNLVLGQSRTKTSTKTHLAKSINRYPKDRLLVQNLHTTNTKKHEKIFVDCKARPKYCLSQTMERSQNSFCVQTHISVMCLWRTNFRSQN